MYFYSNYINLKFFTRYEKILLFPKLTDKTV